MTEKRPASHASAGKSRRKQAAPTIDLKATEVRPETAANDPPRQKPAVKEPPARKPPAQEPPEPTPPAKEPPAKEPPSKEQPLKAPPAPERAETRSAGAATEPQRDSDKTVGDKAVGGKTMGAVLAAGVAGAFAMSLVLLGIWLTGLLSTGEGASGASGERMAALERQVQELRNRPAPEAGANAVSANAVDALAARIAAMEESIKTMSSSAPSGDPALVRRVTEAENAMKALGVALTALNRRSDDIAGNNVAARERAEAAEKAVADLRAGLQDVSKTASAGASSAELQPLQQRIDALEQSARTARAEIDKVAATASAPDSAARLALSAAALRDTVLRGAPFADLLAQAKSLGGDEKTLAPLSSFAATGVPSKKSLARELSALLPGMVKASGGSAPSGGFIERLQANAGQLVRIRPLDAPPGDDAAAVLARIEIATARDDIAAALTDLGKLTDAQRVPAQAWIARAKDREAALAAARQFAADTARALVSK